MENQPLTPLPGSASLRPSEERMWAMLTHLSALPGSFFLIGSIVAPLVIWQVQKDKSAFVDVHGREAVNFQITMGLVFALCFLLVFIAIGVFLLPIVGVIWLIFTIIAAVKANNGAYYRYPLTIRFIK